MDGWMDGWELLWSDTKGNRTFGRGMVDETQESVTLKAE